MNYNIVPMSVRFPKKDMEDIRVLAEAGYATSSADFVRRAVREKIDRCNKDTVVA